MELIDKQAAIDEAEEWIGAVYCDREEQRERSAIKKVIQGIKCLPSAQPEIIRCKDCAKRNALGYCTMFQNNIHGIATSWYMPDDNDFCSYAERKDDVRKSN